MGVAAWYTSFLSTWWARLGVFLIPVALAVASLASGGLRLSHHAATNLNVPAPSLPHLFDAYTTLETEFPAVLFSEVDGVLIQLPSSAPGTLLTPLAAELCDALYNATKSLSRDAQKSIVSVDWFFKFYQSPLKDLAHRYISSDQRSLLVATTINKTRSGVSHDAFRFYQSMPEAVAKVMENSHFQAFHVSFTGQLPAFHEARTATMAGFAITNGAGLPLIALLFWYRTRSLRLLLLPGVCLGLALLMSYGAGLVIAKNTSLLVPNYTPDIILFLVLALCTDYSFFLMSRFQRERRRGTPFLQAVTTMTASSGGVVAISAIVVVFGWLGLLFFPVYGFQAMGVCCALTVLSCLVTNIMVVPPLLCQFPTFFSKTVDTSPKPTSLNDGDTLGAPLLTPSAPAAKQSRRGRCRLPAADAPTCYTKAAARLTRWPLNVVVPAAAFLLFAAGASLLTDLRMPVGLAYNLGDGPVSRAYSTAAATFPASNLRGPFGIAVVAAAPHTAYSEDFMAALCSIGRQVSAVKGVAIPSVRGTGFVVAPNDTLSCVSSAEAVAWVRTPPSHDTPSSAAYKEYAKALVSASNTSAAITFQTLTSPFAAIAESVTADVRAALDAVRVAHPSVASARMYHPVVVEVDSKALALARLPWVLAGSLLMMFALLAVVFKSAFMLVKLVLTLCLPVCCSYGVAVAIYQQGILDWMGWPALSSDGAHGIAWVLPVATVFMTVGLALDYETYLFAAVYEKRADPGLGYTTRQAVVSAVGDTAKTISTAGLILALAFTGMLANDDRFLNEFGFLMIFGVLMDTFVVRGLIVPAVLSWGGDKLQWWPGRMPPPGLAKVSVQAI